MVPKGRGKGQIKASPNLSSPFLFRTRVSSSVENAKFFHTVVVDVGKLKFVDVTENGVRVGFEGLILRRRLFCFENNENELYECRREIWTKKYKTKI